MRKAPHSQLVLIPSAPEGQVVLLWLISCSSWASVNEFFYLLSIRPFFHVFSLKYLKQAAGIAGDQRQSNYPNRSLKPSAVQGFPF